MSSQPIVGYFPCVTYVWLRNIDDENNDEAKQLESASLFSQTPPLVFTPQQVIRKVACGISIAAFATGQGQVFAWRLPDLTASASNLGCPRHIGAIGTRQVIALACGDHHLCCLCDNGEVLMQGCFHFGQLGIGPISEKDLPSIDLSSDQINLFCPCGIPIPKTSRRGLNDVFLLTFANHIVQIACGSKHTLALDSNGKVWGCGMGVAGWEESKSNNQSDLVYYSPLAIQLTKDRKHLPIIRICCGKFHSLAISESGSLHSWGSNKRGELGLGRKSPWELPSIISCESFESPIAHIAASAGSLAVTNDGTIWIWGFSDNDSPRAIPNIQLDQPLDFVTFNDRFTLTSDTLYRLEGNGLLYITLLNSLDKTEIIKENSVGHFDIIASSDRLIIGIVISNSTILLPSVSSAVGVPFTPMTNCQYTPRSPPSFGQSMQFNNEVPFPSVSMLTTSTPSLQQIDQITQSQHQCVSCLKKAFEVEQLKQRAQQLEIELSSFIEQYRRDLINLTSSIESEKSKSQKLCDDMERMKSLSSSINIPGLESWIGDLNRIIQYLKSNDPHNPVFHMVDLNSFIEKVKLIQVQLENERKTAKLAEGATAESFSRVKRLEQLLAETENKLKLVMREKKDLLILCKDLEALQSNDHEKMLLLEEKLKESEIIKEKLKKNAEESNVKKFEMSKAQRELSDLRLELSREQREKLLMKEEKSTLQRRCKTQESQLEELRVELATLKNKVEENEKASMDIVSDMRKSQSKAELLSQEREELEEELKRRNCRYEKLEKEATRLSECLSKTQIEILEHDKTGAAERLQLRQQMQELEKKSKIELDKNAILNEDYRKACQDYAEAKQKISKLTVQIEDLAKLNEETRTQMIEEREMNQLKLKEMNERNVSLMRQLSHRVKGEQEFSDSFKGKFLASEETISEMQQSLGQWRGRYTLLISLLKQLDLIKDNEMNQSNGDGVEEFVNTLGKPHLVVKFVEQEVEKLRSAIASKTAEVEKLNSLVESLETRLEVEELRTKPSQALSDLFLQEKVLALEKELTSKQKQLESLTERLEKQNGSFIDQIEQTPSFREPSLVGKNQVPTSTTVKQQQFRKSTDRLRQPPQIRATNQHNNERHTSAKIKATPLPTSKNSHYKASTNIPANPYSLPAAFRSCEVGPPLHVPQKRHSFSYVM